MNKKIALSAIAMFAVTLGLGVLSPAMATQPDNDGNHKILLCHAAAESNVFNATGDDMWHNSTSGAVVIDVDKAGKLNGHFIKGTDDSRHFNGTDGDWIINATALLADLNGEDDCVPEPVPSMGF